MTDPLSVTASILTLATTGFAVAKGLYNIANEIGSAGEEIRIYSSEVNGTCQVLQTISFALEGHNALGFDYDQILLADIVLVYSRLMEPLDRLQCALKPLLDKFKQSSSKKLSQMGLKLKWVFSTKSKLLLCRTLISSLKEDLHMLLTLLLIRRGSQKEPAKDAMLRESLKTSLAARGVGTSNEHVDFPKAIDMSRDSFDQSVACSGIEDGGHEPQISTSIDLIEASSALPLDLDIIKFELISSPSTTSNDALDETDLQALDQAISSSLSSISSPLLANLARQTASNSTMIARLASGILHFPTFNPNTTLPLQNVSHPAPMQKLYLRLDQNIYDLPLYKFRYWHQIDAFLQNLYRPDTIGKGIGTSPARSTLRDAILSRHFYFQTEEGKRIVLPEFWEDVVRPDVGGEGGDGVVRLEVRIHD